MCGKIITAGSKAPPLYCWNPFAASLVSNRFFACATFFTPPLVLKIKLQPITNPQINQTLIADWPLFCLVSNRFFFA